MANTVNKKFEFSNPLSQEHLDFFEEHGYLHFSNFITRETVEMFRKEMKAIEKQWLEAGIEKVNGVPD